MRYTGEWLYARAKLKNLRVRVYIDAIWLTGSLPKFHLGANIETLHRQETERAIQRLSDELHQPMSEARVFRLDVAQTFAMERRPWEYWQYFLAPTRMARLEFPNRTLTFRNTQRAILLYDKLAEMRREEKNSNRHAGYLDLGRFAGHPNFLRYEAQFKRRLNKVFGEVGLRAASLSNPVFYRKAIEKWEAEYLKLGRISSVSRQALGTTMKSAVNHLAAFGLRSFPPQNYFDHIAAEQRAGRIQAHQAVRMRNKCRELLRAGELNTESDLLQELDDKVRQAVALCD